VSGRFGPSYLHWIRHLWSSGLQHTLNLIPNLRWREELAAVGGVVYAMHYHTITWNQGYQFGLIAFTAAVLGGIGNIVGAGIGGFLIGLVEAFTVTLIPNGGSWALVVIFAVLILVLTLQPTGLLGMRVPDRA